MPKKENRSYKKTPPRSKATQDSTLERRTPSVLASMLVIVLVLVISMVSAAFTSYILRDTLAAISVFIFTLLILAIVIPYFLLATGLLSETVWFQTYVLVLKRIPGLDVIIETFPKLRKK